MCFYCTFTFTYLTVIMFSVALPNIFVVVEARLILYTISFSFFEEISRQKNQKDFHECSKKSITSAEVHTKNRDNRQVDRNSSTLSDLSGNILVVVTSCRLTCDYMIFQSIGLPNHQHHQHKFFN